MPWKFTNKSIFVTAALIWMKRDESLAIQSDKDGVFGICDFIL